MANPLPFKPVVDPKQELHRRLDAAPRQHAEALLVAYDLLQSAHDQGLLDLLNGLVAHKDIVAAKLAEYARLPEGIASIRNLLAAAKILGSIDPETLDNLARAFLAAHAQHTTEARPPSLWQLAKRATSEDSRRGLSLLTLLVQSLGKSLKN